MHVETRLQQSTKIPSKQKSLVNKKYQLVLFETESMIERLLLHAISNFKDLVKKKKKLYVTEFYVFRLDVTILATHLCW